MLQQLTLAGCVIATLMSSWGCSPGVLRGGAPGAPGDATVGDGGQMPTGDTGGITPPPPPPGFDGAPPPPPPGKDATTPPPKPTTWTLGQVPFAPTSSWNTPVPANAKFGKLAWPAASDSTFYVNWDEYTPAVHVSKPTDPLVQVTIPDNWGWPAGKIPVRLPAGVTGAQGTDGEIVIIDGTLIHNFWRLERTGATSATAEAYGRADALTGTGWGTKSPYLSAGTTAAGSNLFAGLLVQAETDAGEINHALHIALEVSLQKPNPTGEAIASDGDDPGGISQEGDRMAIPPSVTMPSGLSPLGQKVFRAMQKYGVYNIDIAGATIIRAQANAYTASTINNLRKDVLKLIPLLQLVK